MITYNNISISEGVFIENNKVYVEGECHELLPNMKMNNINIINNKVYIDGYELKKEGWKRTLKALYYKYIGF